MRIFKTPRARFEQHLRFIRELPCVVCKDNTSVEAAHIRFSDAKVGRTNPGVGQKPHDWWVVPLCGEHHRLQHGMNERNFWRGIKVHISRVCQSLWLNSGDHETCLEIINQAKESEI